MASDAAGIVIPALILSLFAFAMLTAAKEGVRALKNDPKLRKSMTEEGPPVRHLQSLIQKPVQTVTALQVASVLITLLTAMLAVGYLTEPLMRLFGGEAAPADRPLRLACQLLIILLLTFLDSLFGLLIPRRIAAHSMERMIRRTAGFSWFVSAALTPLVWLITQCSNVFLRLIGIDPRKAEEEVTEEEIRILVDMGGETGAIEENEKKMIENIFEFNNRSAEDVMTHRTDVTAIWIGDDRDTIVKTILDTGLSRFPVYDEDIDDIIGILNTRDFLLDLRTARPKPVRALLREAYFVPETVQADVLFRDMQKRKVHMSIVVDEYGGMSGIVTMEDLLEEIVGNIYDEFDPQSEAEIVRIGENKWRISGSASLEDIAEALDVVLPLDEEYDTLGGLIFDQFTTIPQDGTQPAVDVHGLHIQVERLMDHRVETAIVSRLEQPHDPAQPQEEES